MRVLKLAFLLFFSTIVYFQCSQEQGAALEEVPVVDSATLKATNHYKTLCSGCHGEQMFAFADRQWKYGKEKDSIFQSIKNGYPDAGMPGWGAALSDEEIENLTNYILTGIEHVAKYGFQEDTLTTDTFKTQEFTFHLDTVSTEMSEPWGIVFLPSGDMLVTQRTGELMKVAPDGSATEVSGVPPVTFDIQGGLLDIELHPDFANNNWLYLSYSDFKETDSSKISGTAISRFEFNGSALINEEKIFTPTDYTNRPFHYGSRIEFDKEGYLYFSTGDKGNRDVFPQNLNNGQGKIHRINDDGSIPEDNPFIGQEGAVASIYSYGHRNPQGMALDPATNKIWTHEHGPRGGDELNIINKGVNYGWPVVSYGINYDGTTFTNTLDSAGVQHPVLYWTPSIAPSGMTFVTTDKYPGWEGDILVGALRFKYLNRCIMEDRKVVGEEILMRNIGRLRFVKVAPDGFIYFAVEDTGLLFKIVPIS